MKYLIPAFLVILMSCGWFERSPKLPQELDDAFTRLENISNLDERRSEALELWDMLVSDRQVPFTHDSTAVFMYYGNANTVAWNGDFNSWGENPSVKITGKNIDGTDLWYAKHTFPADARLDYKITIDGEEWILDPANPHQQWSGFGPNSELRMPEWEEEPLAKINPAAEKGSFHEQKVIDSEFLEYPVSYRVYTPAGYESMDDLSVIYVTDGPEYSDPQLGNMVTVMDNLHHFNKIRPTVAVFVSPLSVDDEDLNRRADEFANNPAYLDFFINELIPSVEADYNISGKREDRAILGNSLGGLNSTYFAFSRPDLFQHVGIQAPAFWYREEIYNVVKNADFPDADIFMSVGTIGDNTIDARLMKTIFEEKGYDFTYLEVNEGHSWGAWGAQLDDVLVTFFSEQ